MGSVCIVIPAYNEAENLASCLDAIANQTVAPDQVIVVNNNSTDNTATIAKQYHFVTVITEKRQGIAYAHHTGFNYASSDLIARIDAETILPPNWVSQVLEFYEVQNQPIVLVGSGYFYNLRAPKLTHLVGNSVFVTTKLLLGHYPLWGPNFIVPREVWRRVKDSLHFETDIYDDLDIALHVHQAGYPILWQRSLMVGAQMRHCGSVVEFWQYIGRWAQTLKLHNDSRWYAAWLGTAIVFPFWYGLLRLLKR